VELNRLTRHYQWFALVVVGCGGGIALAHLPICPAFVARAVRDEAFPAAAARNCFCLFSAAFRKLYFMYLCATESFSSTFKRKQIRESGVIILCAKVAFMGLHVLTDARAARSFLLNR
jgi:hypothetical protein